MKTVKNLGLIKKIRKHTTAIMIALAAVAVLITVISFSAPALSNLFDQPANAAAEPHGEDLLVIDGNILGIYTNGTYDLLLEEHGLGKLLVAQHGMENEMFEWSFDKNGNIAFDVFWTWHNWETRLDGNTGVISADGNTITVGGMTFTRK